MTTEEHIDWISEEDRESLERMIRFATKAHEGQMRKGTCLPYIVHPIDVMSQLADWEVFCVHTWKLALCHDIYEDCPHINHQLIEDLDSKKLACQIEELTFRLDPNDPRVKKNQKVDYMKGWLVKNEDGVYEKSVESLVVKVADRCCNIWDFLQISSDPKKAYSYFKKADDLFMAMLNRQDEIAERYGEAVFPRMKHTHTQLKSMMN